VNNSFPLLKSLMSELKKEQLSALVGDKKFQVMHKIQSGKRPQKVTVYKFLHKGSLE